MIRFIACSACTVLLIFFLNSKWGSIPPLGKITNPYEGAWQNAEKNNSTIKLVTHELNEEVKVVLDDRFVPHIYAKNISDALFVQGYLHAKNRLWQMDMTTRLASGRLSEVIGDKTLEIDRYHRRLGMNYAAQNSTDAMLQDAETRNLLRAYTSGINFYLKSLSPKNYPIEYKILNYEPEKWTPLKTALMLKYMARTLSTKTDDISNTIAKKVLEQNLYRLLFPERQQKEYPVIQENIMQEQVNKTPVKNDLNIQYKDFFPANRKHKTTGIGSNNWAVAAANTKNKKAILCNDPHLPISLPSIWYECHMHIPETNVYGASLPGAPGIIIGFNNNISWGFTNGYRDVLDYYQITFTDSCHEHYLLNDIPTSATITFDTIKVFGQRDFIDTIYYTHYGPILHDKNFPNEYVPEENLAVKWMAHRGTNELKAITTLNRATNYQEYVSAIEHFRSPHQNIVYADTKGNIALWSQGEFIDKWKGQGQYIMDGNNLENDWGANIPFQDNPHEYNPSRGYVMSANQVNTSADYKYWYNGLFDPSRAKRLSQFLEEKTDYTIEDMQRIQLDDKDQFASDFLEINSSYLPHLNTKADTLNEDLTLFNLWWDEIEKKIYNEGPWKLSSGIDYPNKRTTLHLLKTNQLPIDTATLFKETFENAEMFYTILKENEEHLWHVFKASTLMHMARIPAFSIEHVKMGGGLGMVNAAQGAQAPSWRMIVEMSTPINARVIYPGGQSGNPFSPYYLTN